MTKTVSVPTAEALEEVREHITETSDYVGRVDVAVNRVETKLGTLMNRVAALEELHKPEDPLPAPPVEPPVEPPSGDTKTWEDVLAMPDDTVMEFGAPWHDAWGGTDGRDINCDSRLTALLGAWNGVVWDSNGQYIWTWATAGHDDGCFNGLIRYDMKSGEAEMAVPHEPLNVPYWVDNDGKLIYEPYVSDLPWPGGMQDVVTIDKLTDPFGFKHGSINRIRPLSSHTYNNLRQDGKYLYLTTGSVFKHGKGGEDVWRCDVTASDIAATIIQLPDRVDSNGEPYGKFAVNWIHRPGEEPLMFSLTDVWTVNQENGLYLKLPKGTVSYSTGATLAWDEERQGIWSFDPNYRRIGFAREAEDGSWHFDEGLGFFWNEGHLLDSLRQAGIAIVPTAGSTSPVFWGAERELVRYYPEIGKTEWIDLPGLPEASNRRVYNKVTWNSELECVLFIHTTEHGIFAYKPGWRKKAVTEPPVEPPVEPPSEGLHFPDIAGHPTRPKAVDVVHYNERLPVQPEQPNPDAFAFGPWSEYIDVSSDDDIRALQNNIIGLQSMLGLNRLRVLIQPETYTEQIKLRNTPLIELIGVPDKNGKLPTLLKGASFKGEGFKGYIARNLHVPEGGITWVGNRARNEYPAFAIHDNCHIVKTPNSVVGDSPADAPTTYVQYTNCILGPDTDWHTFYGEASIFLLARGTAFIGSAPNSHALKCIGRRTIIEGCTFSNVGLDGQPIRDDVVGLYPVDLFAGSDTIFRHNTVIYRTRLDASRQFMAYRPRRAHGGTYWGCRRPDDTRAIWQPNSPEYHDADLWGEAQDALFAFTQGYDIAQDEGWLFAHLNEGNTLIAFNAAAKKDGTVLDDTKALSLRSLRPVADNPHREELISEAKNLAPMDEAEFLEAASMDLRYAYLHMDPSNQKRARERGILPRGVPIPHPDGWIERAGLFLGSQTYITVDADGSNARVTGERAVDADPNPYDQLAMEQPPRLIRIATRLAESAGT